MVTSAAIGAWIGRRQKNTTDYFLAGRTIPWYAVTFSIVATETSVLTFISIPAVSYDSNLTFLQICLGYIIGRILVAFLLMPAYYRGEVNTAYHFLGQRFGQKMRNAASLTFIVTRILADGVRLFATAIPLAIIIRGSGLFSKLNDSHFYMVAILIIGIFTMIYTYIGGIRSVIWMDVVQMVIYLGGAVLAGIIIIQNLADGLHSLLNFPNVFQKLQWFYTGFDLSFQEFIKEPYTFFTAVIAGAIFSLASHGTDQIIVQRSLTCRDLRSSQKAIIWSGIVIFLQFLLFLFIGIMLYVFYNGSTHQQLGLTRSDGIFPKFIIEEIPVGISGLIISALFAAAMSTLASSLSSLSSATMLDIYAPLFGRGKTEKQLLKISRYITLVWGVILVAAAFSFIGLKGTVVEVALGIASYTYGGLLGVFLLGIFSKKVNQQDAIIAFAIALIVMTIIIQLLQVAWPLYTVIGSVTAVFSGIISNYISVQLRGKR
jgi:SSS family transporter